MGLEKHILQPETIEKTIEHYCGAYRMAVGDDDKADVSDLLRDFLGRLELTDFEYNHYLSIFEQRKGDVYG